MSKKIEVGMMVEIVGSDEAGREYVGHVGKIIGQFTAHQFSAAFFEVEGAEPEKYAFRYDCLKPIDPESDDIQQSRANPISWDSMMDKLKQKQEVV